MTLSGKLGRGPLGRFALARADTDTSLFLSQQAVESLLLLSPPLFLSQQAVEVLRTYTGERFWVTLV